MNKPATCKQTCLWRPSIVLFETREKYLLGYATTYSGEQPGFACCQCAQVLVSKQATATAAALYATSIEVIEMFGGVEYELVPAKLVQGVVRPAKKQKSTKV